MLKTVFFVLMYYTQFQGDATQATSSSCSVRPASDIRGSPGVPGRPGSKGEPGYGKLVKRQQNIVFLWFAYIVAILCKRTFTF